MRLLRRPTSPAPTEAGSLSLTWALAGHRFELVEPRLFFVKAASVLLLSFALLPIISIRDGIPARIYVVALVVLHIAVLGIYFYRVRIRELDVDSRALVLRVIALAVVVYLLVIVSKFDPEGPRATLALQLLAVAIFHALLLGLVMIRHVRDDDARRS